MAAKAGSWKTASSHLPSGVLAANSVNAKALDLMAPSLNPSSNNTIAVSFQLLFCAIFFNVLREIVAVMDYRIRVENPASVSNVYILFAPFVNPNEPFVCVENVFEGMFDVVERGRA